MHFSFICLEMQCVLHRKWMIVCLGERGRDVRVSVSDTRKDMSTGLYRIVWICMWKPLRGYGKYLIYSVFNVQNNVNFHVHKLKTDSPKNQDKTHQQKMIVLFAQTQQLNCKLRVFLNAIEVMKFKCGICRALSHKIFILIYRTKIDQQNVTPLGSILHSRINAIVMV